MQTYTQENLKMNPGELLLVKKEEIIYGYIFRDSVNKHFTRVTLEHGAYLIISRFLDKFYEVLVDKRIVLVKLEDKFQNSPN